VQFVTALGIIFSSTKIPMSYYSFYLPSTFLPIILAGLYFLFEDKLSSPRLRWAWWIGSLILIGLVGFYVIQDHALYDYFKGYYHGGRKIIRNIDVLYDDACYGFTNFPLFAYLFVPLANLPKELSGRIFFLIGYLCLLPLVYWLVTASNVKGWQRFLVLALLAFNGPLDYSIWLGNTTQIVMLFILLAFFSLNRRWDWISGILLGVGGLIKLPLVLPSGYFFLRGKWKVVGGGLLVAGAVLFLSLVLLPFELNSIWLERCVLMMAGNPTAAYNNQSLSGFLARIFMPGNYGWDPLTPTPAYITASNIGRILLSLRHRVLHHPSLLPSHLPHRLDALLRPSADPRRNDSGKSRKTRLQTLDTYPAHPEFDPALGSQGPLACSLRLDRVHADALAPVHWQFDFLRVVAFGVGINAKWTFSNVRIMSAHKPVQQ
jgi:hypothetical protein